MSPLFVIAFVGVVSTVYGQSSRIPFVRFASTAANVAQNGIEAANSTETQVIQVNLGHRVNLNDVSANYTTDMPLEMLILRADAANGEETEPPTYYWPFESICLYDVQCNNHCLTHHEVCEGSLNSTCLEATCYRGSCFYCCEKEHGHCEYPIPGIKPRSRAG